MTASSKIWLTLGFLASFMAYSLFPYIWHGGWYDLTAFSFVCYTRVIYEQSHGSWSLMAFIVWLTTINALADELFFDPRVIELNEYIGFAILVIVSIKYKKRLL